MNQLEPFIEYGWMEGRSPHPLFDAQWYLDVGRRTNNRGSSQMAHMHGGFQRIL
jgi:hypothetical protein